MAQHLWGFSVLQLFCFLSPRGIFNYTWKLIAHRYHSYPKWSLASLRNRLTLLNKSSHSTHSPLTCPHSASKLAATMPTIRKSCMDWNDSVCWVDKKGNKTLRVSSNRIQGPSAWLLHYKFIKFWSLLVFCLFVGYTMYWTFHNARNQLHHFSLASSAGLLPVRRFSL